MKVLTIILAIMVSSTSFGKNWNDGGYKNAMRVFDRGFTADDGCDSYLEPIMRIIEKVSQKVFAHNQKAPSNVVAKAVAKAILINTEDENDEMYKFESLELEYITHVRNHFIGHILKHFSTVDGTLPQNGIHTRLIYDMSMDLERMQNVAIPTILNTIIDKGSIGFDVMNGTMKIKMKEDSGISVSQIANEVNGKIGGFKVEELQGQPGTKFSDKKNQRKNLNKDNIYFFFKLHLGPTCNDSILRFRFRQAKTSPPDGRYGSCFVDCRRQL